MAKHVPASAFTVGWICALAVELAAALEMLDEKYAYHQSYPNDFNSYSFGRVGTHNVVIVGLPAGQIGTSPAATAVTQMHMRFPSLRFSLLVGIAGAVPGRHDIRLGDVVISKPMGPYGGVVQYDFGKRGRNGRLKITGHLDAPPPVLLSALTSLEANMMLDMVDVDRHLAKLVARPYFRSPGSKNDVLYRPSSEHVEGATCEKCRKADVLPRRPRSSTRPVLFMGTIASGNQVMKDAPTRDKYSRDLADDIMCFEMEAAGLMRSFRCLVIRGMCDYADAHKNKHWQPYAAATAAAYAKELLSFIRPEMSPALDVSVAAEVSRASEVLRNRDVGLAASTTANTAVALASLPIQDLPPTTRQGVPSTTRSPSESEVTSESRTEHPRRSPLESEPLTHPAPPTNTDALEKTATANTQPATEKKESKTDKTADEIANLRMKGKALEKEAKLEEAEVVYRECLEDVTGLRGPQHRDRMITISCLIDCLWRQKKWPSVQQFATELLSFQNILLGHDDELVIYTMDRLGRSYYQQGQYHQAKVHHGNAMGLADTVSGAQSSRARRARWNLALSCEKLGELDKATELFATVAEADISVLGPNHTDTLTAKFCMGRCMCLNGAPGAQMVLEGTFRRMQEVRGPLHLETLECMRYAAQSFETRNLEDQKKAESIYSEYLPFARKVFKHEPRRIHFIKIKLVSLRISQRRRAIRKA